MDDRNRRPAVSTGRKRPAQARARLRAVFSTLLLLLAGGLVAAPQAQAVETRATAVQLRGVGGNCLTADGTGALTYVTMRACGSVASSRQNWNVIRWGTGLSIQGGLALTTNPGLCLGTAGNSTSAGALAVLQACSQGSNPSVQWDPADLVVGTPGDIHDYRAGRCLDVQLAKIDQGTPVWLYNCNGDSDAQTWMIGSPSYAGPVINSRIDIGWGSLCLSAPSAVPAQGARLTVEFCSGNLRQRWVEINGYFMLGGKCLDIRGPSAADGTPVQMYTCVDVRQQRWREQASGVLKSEYANVCLDVAGGGVTSGSAVWSWACNATHAQGWYHGAVPTQFISTGALAAKLNGAMEARLATCAGLLSYSTTRGVSFVAARRPAAQAVWRGSGLFSDAARTIGAGIFGNRAAINGQWFIEAAPSANNPFGRVPQGDIWIAGQRVNANPFDSDYHGYNITVPTTGTCGSQWSIGPQSNALSGERPYLNGAPADGFAFGGGRPLIINNVKWGPGTPRDWPTAEKWDYYETLLGLGLLTGNGKTTVGVRGDGMVMFIVQRHSTTGSGERLSSIRDAYALLGFKDAVVFDSNSSSTLAVNGSLLATPSDGKSAVIPVGLVMGNN